jgi:hypothetical protein
MTFEISVNPGPAGKSGRAKIGIPGKRLAACLAIMAIFSNGAALLAQAAKSKKPRGAIKSAIASVPAAFRFPGWIAAGQTQKFRKDKLSDCVGQEAAFVLEYGFVDLAIHRFKPLGHSRNSPGKEIVLELYRMESPEDAFGIFSIRRTGAEKVSDLVGTANWVGPGGAELIKGTCYLRLLSTGCEETEIEKITASAAHQIKLPVAAPPAGFSWLPKTNLVARSERYIRGRLAAQKESPLLGKGLWGFETGGCKAYAGRYSPKNSKLVILDFGRKADDLSDAVLSLFREYLENVRKEGSTVIGEDTASSIFIFGQGERTAALILGEPDREAARARLADALSNAENGESRQSH